jgi:hypothetical protein
MRKTNTFSASQLASLRKVNEASQPKPPISTPAEFSRLKYERELKLQERQEQYRQQMIATQRVSLYRMLIVWIVANMVLPGQLSSSACWANAESAANVECSRENYKWYTSKPWNSLHIR